VDKRALRADRRGNMNGREEQLIDRHPVQSHLHFAKACMGAWHKKKKKKKRLLISANWRGSWICRSIALIYA